MMRGYTTIEQSKKLAEILPIESADMFYWCGDQIRLGSYRAMDKDLDIPAWSLAALLNALQEVDNNIEFWSNHEDWYLTVATLNDVYSNSLVDACVKMIEFLHKENLI